MTRMRFLSFLAAAAVLGLSATAHAQAVQPTSGLVLYDADGKRVGPILRSAGAAADFAMRIDGHALYLGASGPTALGSGSIGGNVRVGPWFEAPDCAGPLLLSIEEANDHGPFLPVVVESSPPGLHPKSTIYVPDASQPPRMATIRSGIGVGGRSTCENVPEGPAMVVPMLRLADFLDLHRFPLKARAEPAVDLPGLLERVKALEAENAALRERVAGE